MIGDLGEHKAQPGFGVNTVKLSRADQRVDGGGALATAVGTGKQVVAPANGDVAQRPLAAELSISMMPSSQ